MSSGIYMQKHFSSSSFLFFINRRKYQWSSKKFIKSSYSLNNLPIFLPLSFQNATQLRNKNPPPPAAPVRRYSEFQMCSVNNRLLFLAACPERSLYSILPSFSFLWIIRRQNYVHSDTLLFPFGLQWSSLEKSNKFCWYL